MNSRYEELYDYDALRTLTEPTAFVVRLDHPALILGSSQPDDLFRPEVADTLITRRRRGGGGAVLVQPDDLWVDWWLPAGDARILEDVTAMATKVGMWWLEVLHAHRPDAFTLHGPGVSGPEPHRIACFAGGGPGEVYFGESKLVGVTQWRVREGVLVSTMLPLAQSDYLIACLNNPPEGLREVLEQGAILAHLELDADPEDLVRQVVGVSGEKRARQLMLLP
jgi:lipoate-protein ligase A